MMIKTLLFSIILLSAPFAEEGNQGLKLYVNGNGCSYADTYGSADVVDDAHDKFPDLNPWTPAVPKWHAQPLTVYVTSAKELKIEAAREGLQSMWGSNVSFTITGIKSESGVPDQPLGFIDIGSARQGANNRINNLLQSLQDQDVDTRGIVVVSIESFFTTPDFEELYAQFSKNHRADKRKLVYDYPFVVILLPGGIRHEYVGEGLGIAEDIYNLTYDQAQAEMKKEENLMRGLRTTLGQTLKRIYGMPDDNWHECVPQSRADHPLTDRMSRKKQILAAFKLSTSGLGTVD